MSPEGSPFVLLLESGTAALVDTITEACIPDAVVYLNPSN